MADTGAEDAGFMEENSFAQSEGAAGKPSKLTGFKNTLKRILIGLVIIAVGVGVFFLGGIIGAGEEIVNIAPSPMNAATNGKLVYVTGTPNSQDFTDPLFNVSTKGLGLERVVEMYQWAKEGEQYSQKWSEDLIVMSDEDKAKGYENPPELPFRSEKWNVDKIALGSFALSVDFAKQVNVAAPLPLTKDDFAKLNDEGQQAFKLAKDSYFFGLDPEKPNTGDLRISFKASAAGPVTIIGKQAGDSLDTFIGKNGPIGFVRQGVVPLDALKQGINLGENSTIKWGCRGGSLLFLLVGVLVIKGRKSKAAKPKKSKKKKGEEEIVSHNETYGGEEHLPEGTQVTEHGEHSQQDYHHDAADATQQPQDYQHYNEDGEIPAAAPSFNTADYQPYAPEEAAPPPPPPAQYAPSPPPPALPPVPEPMPAPVPKFSIPEPLEFNVQEPAPMPQPPSPTSAPPPPAMPPVPQFVEAVSAPLPPMPTASERNYAPQPPVYMGAGYGETQAEDMPFEVEILSEDTLGQPQSQGDEPPSFLEQSVATLSNESGLKIDHPDFTEQNYSDQLMNESQYTDSLLEEIPSEVEIMSEIEPAQEFSDHANITAAPPIPSFESVAYQQPDAVMPPVPSFESPAYNQPEPEIAAEPAPVYEEPVLDSPAPSALQMDANPLPPRPDFDKLFAVVRGGNDTPAPAPQASEPAPAQMPASSFDLPGIPAEFDPRAEMLAPEPNYDIHTGDSDHFTHDDGGHSPFGDAVDDPFAHHDEEKK